MQLGQSSLPNISAGLPSHEGDSERRLLVLGSQLQLSEFLSIVFYLSYYGDICSVGSNSLPVAKPLKVIRHSSLHIVNSAP